MVNPNYTKINAKEQMSRADSVFHYYQKLIALRRKYPVIVYGKYAVLMPDSDKIFAYQRTLEDDFLLVACNFTGTRVTGSWGTEQLPQKAECLISNYEETVYGENCTLRPYEAVVWMGKVR